MLYQYGQMVTGRPGTAEEFITGLVLDVDLDNHLVLIEITECEYDDDELGEEMWVNDYDLVLVEDLNYTADTPTYSAPVMDMNQALVLGII